MTDYLSHQFDRDAFDLVSVTDELPLWSAPFGMRLLDTIQFKPNLAVLDIGCGLGFPLVEVAERLGPSCTVYGIDPWERAVERIRLKLKTYQINNVKVSTGAAEAMPFDDNFLICWFRTTELTTFRTSRSPFQNAVALAAAEPSSCLPSICENR